MADFWAGYLSGAAGILVGNPLDLIKVRRQAGAQHTSRAGAIGAENAFKRASELLRGVPAPVLGYGALNGLLYVTYNRTLSILNDDPSSPATASKIWLAGAAGGLATWVISAPTELVKCRAQLALGEASSMSIARDIIQRSGLRGFYHGGVVTSLRDSIGFGFYFWSYELSKRWIKMGHGTHSQTALNVLLCGGLAGLISWASIFPLGTSKDEDGPNHLPVGLL